MVSCKDKYLLKVEELRVYFPANKGVFRRTADYIRAADGVTFGIERGQTFGLVGASGCGKTTIAKSILRLLPATSGRITFEQVDVLQANMAKIRQLRKQISLIFQNPHSSLNPRITVGNTISEPLKVHKNVTGSELTERVAELLSKVGISQDYINRYPHELSGGQRQRIAIARVLALQPKFIVCDEPTSAVDVSVQSQILNLLKDLQETFGLTYLFISHDLTVVEFFCDIVAVMYMGRIVEQAPAQQLHREPLHPHTRSLISAIPKLKQGHRLSQIASAGSELPSTPNWLTGCPFHHNCSLADNRCLNKTPQLMESNNQKGHFVACWKC